MAATAAKGASSAVKKWAPELSGTMVWEMALLRMRVGVWTPVAVSHATVMGVGLGLNKNTVVGCWAGVPTGL